MKSIENFLPSTGNPALVPERLMNQLILENNFSSNLIPAGFNNDVSIEYISHTSFFQNMDYLVELIKCHLGLIYYCR